MKYSKFKKNLKDEFNKSTEEKEVEVITSKPKFQFKLRYLFISLGIVAALILVINHLVIVNQNNSNDYIDSYKNYEDYEINTNKYSNKALLKNDLVTYEEKEEKTSILQGIINFFTLSGCSASTSKGDDAAINTENNYQTNAVEVGIDESDTAKCDGEYIYSLVGDYLYIYDLDGNVILNIDIDCKLYEIYVYEGKIVFVPTEGCYIKIYSFDGKNFSQEKIIGTSNFIDSRLLNGCLYYIEFAYDDDYINNLRYENTYYDGCINPNGYYKINKLNLNTYELESTELVSRSNAKIYMSYNYFYVITNNYGYGCSTTNIFIFDLDLNSYFGIKELGIANDKYSFSEYNDTFRFVLTENDGGVQNSIYAYDLKEKALAGKLENAIGLVGEHVESVRFNQDRCYICTYRNTDPLYVIDLSDLNNIEILSELHMPGFITYIHTFNILDERYILCLGYNDYGYEKLEIYKDNSGELEMVGRQLYVKMEEDSKIIAGCDSYRAYKESNYNEYPTLLDNPKSYYFETDGNLIYFGAPVTNRLYTMFKINVTNTINPILVYYEYEGYDDYSQDGYYIESYYNLRCFLINSKYYYFGDGHITIRNK